MTLCYPLLDPQLHNISITSELFKNENITITLEWTQVNNSLVPYHVSIIPQTVISYNGGTQAQVTIPYNILYNVSISAVIPCGLNTTTSITLYYSKCMTTITIIIKLAKYSRHDSDIHR